MSSTVCSWTIHPRRRFTTRRSAASRWRHSLTGVRLTSSQTARSASTRRSLGRRSPRTMAERRRWYTPSARPADAAARLAAVPGISVIGELSLGLGCSGLRGWRAEQGQGLQGRDALLGQQVGGPVQRYLPGRRDVEDLVGALED